MNPTRRSEEHSLEIGDERATILPIDPGAPTRFHSGVAGAPVQQGAAPTNPEPRSFMQQRKPWTVRPRPPSCEDWVGDRATPVDHGFPDRPGLYRSGRTPVAGRESGAPMSSRTSEPPISDGALAALMTATTAIVCRQGSVGQEALVATLMERGLSRMDALFVIRSTLLTGAIARVSGDPLHLRAPTPASIDSGEWFPR